MRIFIVILMLIVMIMLRVVVIFMAMLISQVQTSKGKDKKAYDRLDNKYRKQVNRSCRSHPLFFLSDSIRIVCVKRV